MKITIIGAGALGSAIGGFLSRENEVTLVGRSDHVRAINSSGLKVSGIWGDHLFRELQTGTDVACIKATQDIIMIATKSYDTAAAVCQVLPLVGPGTYVMSMQNGLGNERTIAESVGDGRTMGGMAIFGVVVVAPGHVRVTVFGGECKVGALEGSQDKAKEFAVALQRSGIPTAWSGNILADKWLKAFYNIALNGLSAILRVPYGVLGEREETRRIMGNLLTESFAVAAAEKVHLPFTRDSYFRHFMETQLPATAQHRSSMLEDISRGRRTEIDYLNGMIVTLGRKHDLATPVNETLVGIIKTLEAQTRAKETV